MTIYEYINDFFIYIIILILVVLIFLYHFKPDLFTINHLDNFENKCNNSCSNYLKNDAYSIEPLLCQDWIFLEKKNYLFLKASVIII